MSVVTRADPVGQLREATRQAVDREGLRPLCARLGVNVGRVRSITSGRVPYLDRADEICRALGISLTIGAALPVPNPVEIGAAVDEKLLRRARALQQARWTRGALHLPWAAREPAFEPVSDRRLAELLARLADHWEASPGPDRERIGFAIDVALTGTGERERPALARVVGWLGWRVMDGAGSAGRGAEPQSTRE